MLSGIKHDAAITVAMLPLFHSLFLLLVDWMAGILLLMDVSGFSTDSLLAAVTTASRVWRRTPSPIPKTAALPKGTVRNFRNRNAYCSAATSPYEVSASLRSFTTDRVVRSPGIDPLITRNTSLFYLVWNCPLSCRSFVSVVPQDINLDHQVTETSNSAFSALSTFKKNIMYYQHMSLPQAKYWCTWQYFGLCVLLLQLMNHSVISTWRTHKTAGW